MSTLLEQGGPQLCKDHPLARERRASNLTLMHWDPIESLDASDILYYANIALINLRAIRWIRVLLVDTLPVEEFKSLQIHADGLRCFRRVGSGKMCAETDRSCEINGNFAQYEGERVKYREKRKASPQYILRGRGDRGKVASSYLDGGMDSTDLRELSSIVPRHPQASLRGVQAPIFASVREVKHGTYVGEKGPFVHDICVPRRTRVLDVHTQARGPLHCATTVASLAAYGIEPNRLFLSLAVQSATGSLPANLPQATTATGLRTRVFVYLGRLYILIHLHIPVNARGHLCTSSGSQMAIVQSVETNIGVFRAYLTSGLKLQVPHWASSTTKELSRLMLCSYHSAHYGVRTTEHESETLLKRKDIARRERESLIKY
ncbi:hypothetical protein BDY19DRAFT_910398 [Irpex rosettiformis]|uniref:Uncharacterized protein n=1 Tax=Irpex rosettiformis TaxID=378272 RepID=A0ACB8TNW4_9APHY|nr:hypothetical protein BDY19DRAFT_910398 [Irpex rosettiformis]